MLWLSITGFRKLSRLIGRYRNGVEKHSSISNWDQSRIDMTLDVLGGLKSQDVELLLDLLAETNGLEVALRILTQLDVQFHEAWRVRGIKQVVRDDFSLNFGKNFYDRGIPK